jgi:holo-[acyl-carrier protein] synthase
MSGAKPMPGAICGIGTDIIECVRIAEMIEKHGEIFLTRVYTREEIAYCSARKAANQHYAGRWAAKEAVLKALGTGWSRGIHWTDVEVVNAPGGKPSIVLAGMARQICQQQSIAEILISISHCRNYAVAFATALSG